MNTGQAAGAGRTPLCGEQIIFLLSDCDYLQRTKDTRQSVCSVEVMEVQLYVYSC